MATCCVCFELAGDGLCCRREGDGHWLCGGCAVVYVRTSCAGPRDDFERLVLGTVGESTGLTSEPGQLPCPQFKTGSCRVASIPHSEVLGSVARRSPAAAETLLRARDRVVEERTLQGEAGRRLAAEAQRPPESAVDRAAAMVMAAMRFGQSVRCPGCAREWVKTADSCVHMTCGGCRARFCYSCGRLAEERCGCDSETAFLGDLDEAFFEALEDDFDWDGPAGGQPMMGFPPRWPPAAAPARRPLSRVVRAEQAVQRFHFELIRFYVSDVRRLLGQSTWSELLRARPRILDDVVPGHRLREADLGEATFPPLLGRAADRPTTEAARLRRAWRAHLLDLKLWPAAGSESESGEAARLELVAGRIERAAAATERAARGMVGRFRRSEERGRGDYRGRQGRRPGGRSRTAERRR